METEDTPNNLYFPVYPPSDAPLIVVPKSNLEDERLIFQKFLSSLHVIVRYGFWREVETQMVMLDSEARGGHFNYNEKYIWGYEAMFSGKSQKELCEYFQIDPQLLLSSRASLMASGIMVMRKYYNYHVETKCSKNTLRIYKNLEYYNPVKDRYRDTIQQPDIAEYLDGNKDIKFVLTEFAHNTTIGKCLQEYNAGVPRNIIGTYDRSLGYFISGKEIKGAIKVVQRLSVAKAMSNKNNVNKRISVGLNLLMQILEKRRLSIRRDDVLLHSKRIIEDTMRSDLEVFNNNNHPIPLELQSMLTDFVQGKSMDYIVSEWIPKTMFNKHEIKEDLFSSFVTFLQHLVWVKLNVESIEKISRNNNERFNKGLLLFRKYAESRL